MEAFDPAIHDTFCEMTGLTTDALAWEQATLPASSGGLGLRSSVLLADAAYIGSRHATLECCATLWPLFCWDGGLPGTDLHATLERYRASIADVGLQYPLGTQPSTQMTQSSLSAQLGAAQCVRWLARANNDDACRLHAYSADGADAALGLVPLHALDTSLFRDDFLALVGGQLGTYMLGRSLPLLWSDHGLQGPACLELHEWER